MTHSEKISIDKIVALSISCAIDRLWKYISSKAVDCKTEVNDLKERLRKFIEKMSLSYNIYGSCERLGVFLDIIGENASTNSNAEDLNNLERSVFKSINIILAQSNNTKSTIKRPLLKSIFSLINMGHNVVASEKVHSLKLLSLNQVNWPKTPSEIGNNDMLNLLELLKYFLERANELLPKTDYKNEILLLLMEECFSYVPSFTSLDDTISLYDYCKLNIAIASCLYHSLNNNQVLSNPEEPQFLLVAGDLSSVQNFIYTISRRGALKLLRARSSYLEFLVEDVITQILDKFKLSRANLIYSGGSRFYLLIPYLPDSCKILGRIKDDVNKFLYQQFWTDLYLALQWIRLTQSELMTLEAENKSIWLLISNQLRSDKNRKFESRLKDVDSFFRIQDLQDCQICKRGVTILYDLPPDLRVCESCRDLLKFGELMPKSKAFYRCCLDQVPLGKNDVPFSLKLPFSSLLVIKSLDNLTNIPPNGILYVKGGIIPKTVNSTEKLDSIFKYRLQPVLVPDFTALSNDSPIDLDTMGERALGSKKVAAVRMDVDNLGTIFARGLDKNYTSLAHFATLSRQLHWFFRGYVDQLAKEGLNDLKWPVLLDFPQSKTPKNLSIVYSGGDDLFIIGAWNDVVEITFTIHHAFSKYVGENPNLTLSAGLYIFDPKFPLYKMAEVTHDLLEIAKNEKKNRIMIQSRFMPETTTKSLDFYLPRSIEWGDFYRMWNICKDLYDSKKHRLNSPMSRGVIIKIFNACHLYSLNPKSSKWLMYLAYHLSRSKTDNFFSTLLSYDFKRINKGEPQDIYNIEMPLRLIDLAIRG